MHPLLVGWSYPAKGGYLISLQMCVSACCKKQMMPLCSVEYSPDVIECLAGRVQMDHNFPLCGLQHQATNGNSGQDCPRVN